MLGSDEGYLAQRAWFGPPMARRSLALPMLLFCNGLHMKIRGRKKSFFGEVVGNCCSLSLFAPGHYERTMELPSPSFSRPFPKRQRTGAVHDLADIA